VVAIAENEPPLQPFADVDQQTSYTIALAGVTLSLAEAQSARSEVSPSDVTDAAPPNEGALVSGPPPPLGAAVVVNDASPPVAVPLGFCAITR
jgi:hypothetical protein